MIIIRRSFKIMGATPTLSTIFKFATIDYEALEHKDDGVDVNEISNSSPLAAKLPIVVPPNVGDNSNIVEKMQLSVSVKKASHCEAIDVLTKAGHIVIPTIPDGACLFRAFSLVITGFEDQHQFIRDTAVMLIKNNSEKLLAFLPEDCGCLAP